jgi:peptidyl-prolyl cis-trans isomerase A (cyclophilin A)
MKRIGLLAAALTLLAAAPCPAQQKNPVVVMETSMGTVKIELFPKEAPITVKNFLDYVDKKQYDGTIFHRVIENFMIQGGGFTTGRVEKDTGAPIKNESLNGVANDRGTIAMARTNAPNSATAQFFINVKNNAGLNGDPNSGKIGYAVFGKVIEGMDVVDKIRQVQTGNAKFKARAGGGQLIDADFDDVPVQPVTIKSIRRVGAR